MNMESHTQQHFKRTKLCKFELLGMCTKGPQCPFAHGATELRALPDLRRTKLCKELILNGTCTRKGCSYAHNKEELRSTGASHKTKLCRFLGSCALGAKCNFAHSTEELRAADRDELLQEGISPPPGLNWGKTETGAAQSGSRDLAAFAHAPAAQFSQIGPTVEVANEDAPAYVRLPVTSDSYSFSKLTGEPIEGHEQFDYYGYLNGDGQDPNGLRDVDKEVTIPGFYCDNLASNMLPTSPGSWEAISPAFGGNPGLVKEDLWGSVVIDQSNDTWQVKSDPRMSAAFPRWPMRSVRTSESTLCSLSDM